MFSFGKKISKELNAPANDYSMKYGVITKFALFTKFLFLLQMPPIILRYLKKYSDAVRYITRNIVNLFEGSKMRFDI